MGYNAFRARMNQMGSSVGEIMKTSTESLVDDLFENAPTYRIVTINEEEVGVRIVSGKESSLKRMLMRPNSTCDIGTLVEDDGVKWLVFDSETQSISPSAELIHCNNVLKWKNKTGDTKEYPCSVISSLALLQLDEQQLMTMQNGEIKAVVQYNDDIKQILLKQRFLFGKNAYEITGFDDLSKVSDGKGMATLVLGVTTTTTKDDFTNQIADNSALFGTTSTTTPTSGTTGGVKW